MVVIYNIDKGNNMTYNYPKTNANLNTTYPDKLKDIGLTLLEQYTGSKKHHLMKCNTCEHEWSATPKSKIANFKKFGKGGCPECTKRLREENDYIPKRKAFIQKILNNGFEILSDYDGSQELNNKFTVRNIKCGHVFETRPKNIISRNVNCPICNTQRKREAFQQFNIERQEEYQKTASDWNIYRHCVYQLTRQTYKEHQSTINPTNLPRGKAGVDGAYHLDHIVPVRYCFNNNIPSDICAHSSNLQMLNWNDNVGSRDKLKLDLPIPTILQEYVNSTS